MHTFARHNGLERPFSLPLLLVFGCMFAFPLNVHGANCSNPGVLTSPAMLSSLVNCTSLPYVSISFNVTQGNIEMGNLVEVGGDFTIRLFGFGMVSTILFQRLRTVNGSMFIYMDGTNTAANAIQFPNLNMIRGSVNLGGNLHSGLYNFIEFAKSGVESLEIGGTLNFGSPICSSRIGAIFVYGTHIIGRTNLTSPSIYAWGCGAISSVYINTLINFEKPNLGLYVANGIKIERTTTKFERMQILGLAGISGGINVSLSSNANITEFMLSGRFNSFYRVQGGVSLSVSQNSALNDIIFSRLDSIDSFAIPQGIIYREIGRVVVNDGGFGVVSNFASCNFRGIRPSESSNCTCFAFYSGTNCSESLVCNSTVTSTISDLSGTYVSNLAGTAAVFQNQRVPSVYIRQIQDTTKDGWYRWIVVQNTTTRLISSSVPFPANAPPGDRWYNYTSAITDFYPTLPVSQAVGASDFLFSMNRTSQSCVVQPAEAQPPVPANVTLFINQAYSSLISSSADAQSLLRTIVAAVIEALGVPSSEISGVIVQPSSTGKIEVIVQAITPTLANSLTTIASNGGIKFNFKGNSYDAESSDKGKDKGNDNTGTIAAAAAGGGVAVIFLVWLMLTKRARTESPSETYTKDIQLSSFPASSPSMHFGPRFTDFVGYSPLHVAILKGDHAELVRLLSGTYDSIVPMDLSTSGSLSTGPLFSGANDGSAESPFLTGSQTAVPMESSFTSLEMGGDKDSQEVPFSRRRSASSIIRAKGSYSPSHDESLAVAPASIGGLSAVSPSQNVPSLSPPPVGSPNGGLMTSSLSYKLTGSHSLSVDAQDPSGATPLAWAVRLKDLVAMRILLSSRADVNARNFKGQTALHLCCMEGAEEPIVSLLLSSGADPNIIDDNMMTPFLYACRQCTGRVVGLFVGAGGNSKSTDINGLNATMLAASLANSSALQVLCAWEKNDLNFQDASGWTALHWASAVGDGACVATLLSAPTVNPRLVTKSGDTIVHLATREGNVRALDVILQHGARSGDDFIPFLQTKSNSGLSAIQLAQITQQDECFLRLSEEYARLGLEIELAPSDASSSAASMGASPQIVESGSAPRGLAGSKRAGGSEEEEEEGDGEDLPMSEKDLAQLSPEERQLELSRQRRREYMRAKRSNDKSTTRQMEKRVAELDRENIRLTLAVDNMRKEALRLRELLALGSG